LKKVNILIWALSLFIASVLWGYVAFYINPEGEKPVYNIPIEFRNDASLNARELILVDGTDATVDVRFSGRIQYLAGITRESVRAIVDLRNVSAGETAMGFTIEGTNVHLVTYHPIQSTVTITTDRVMTKLIDLRLELIGEAAEGFLRDPEEFYPTRLQITGPSKEVESIHEAVVVFEPNGPLSRSVSDIPVDYRFRTEAGQDVESPHITADYNSVRLTIPIFMEKTVPLFAELIEGGGLTRNGVEVYIEPRSVRIAGSPEQLEWLNNIPIDTINLAQLERDYDNTVVIHYPEGVRNLDHIDEARVSVKINTPSIEILTTNISIQGLVTPYEYTHTLITNSVGVTLRGPAEYLAQIQPGNVRVVVDFTGIEISAPGRQRQQAAIFIDGFDSVGALDKGYWVTIDIVPIEAEGR
jgi:YbbR domain-containing protein